MQVDPMTPMLKPPGTGRLTLFRDVLLSTSALKFNLRRYMKEQIGAFTEGFNDIVPREIISLLNPSELELLISGRGGALPHARHVMPCELTQ